MAKSRTRLLSGRQQHKGAILQPRMQPVDVVKGIREQISAAVQLLHKLFSSLGIGLVERPQSHRVRNDRPSPGDKNLVAARQTAGCITTPCVTVFAEPA